MKQTASGWVILTRKLVAGFHPQNDNNGIQHKRVEFWVILVVQLA